MRLVELPLDELRRRLAGDGILLETGPFTVRVRSAIKDFAWILGRFYAQFPVLSRPTVTDFHVRLIKPFAIRRWLRPQALFMLDDQSPFMPYPLSHSFPLFEWGLNWCIAMLAHQYLMLHSAAIERSGKVLLLPAWPGSGKSTLCAALVSRGWRLFSDEFGLVRSGDGHLVPLPRPVPLKNKSIDIIRAFDPELELGPAFHGTRKGTVSHLLPAQSCVEQAAVTAPPAWIVFPRYQSAAALDLEPIDKPQAFMKLANNSFNYRLLGLRGFHETARVVRNCDSYILTYSDLNEAVAAINRLVEV